MVKSVNDVYPLLVAFFPVGSVGITLFWLMRARVASTGIQQKTGEYVYLPILDDVGASLRTVKHKHPDYFFWSGGSKVPAAVSVWRRRLADVFDRAGIKNGHSHRLRDTFAVRMLEAGLSVENVSTLLGHASIKVTQRHYSPW